MNSEKRIILFVALTFAWFVGMQYLGDALGLNPPPPAVPKPPAGAAVPPVVPKTTEPMPAEPGPGQARAGAAVAAKDTAASPAISLARSSELVLKSDRLQVQLEQAHAGVESVVSLLYEAEFEAGKLRHRPLTLVGARDEVGRGPKLPPSMLVTLLPTPDGAAVDPASATDSVVWEVVRDADGRAVRPVTREASNSKGAPVKGREIQFRKGVDELGVILTKTYRLYDGVDGFEFELGFEGVGQERTLAYRLVGPHGIPIEGEWYTGTFRDVFFGQLDGTSVKIETRAALDIAKDKESSDSRFTNLPLVFAGVENQYFAAFVSSKPPPRTNEDRLDAESMAVVIHEDPQAQQKADVAVAITSKPLRVGPNLPVKHTYQVFTGPKTFRALAPYGAGDLASYRKNQWFSIPFASSLAQNVIAPLLDRIYLLTKQVAGFFGSEKGNYGIAIILLTLTVRMMMFPLGRKQALMAKKMQDLQPHLKELQEKYKDDKEQLTKETWALYKRHKANPIGGCLPALIQMPILVGLWQALNNSVPLRNAPFLYIKNLAAPDMLFRFPTEIPFLGDYFNLLPFLVVSLMLVQTKLFSPPATTPEAEMQQKMMKYMMIFMAFMFYKVPSGLGIYFIMSSLWSIGERLILPKITKSSPVIEGGGDEKNPPTGGDEKNPPPGGGGKGGPAGNGSSDKPGGWLSKRLEKLLDDAAQDATFRKDPKDPNKVRDKGKPRARPGRRR